MHENLNISLPLLKYALNIQTPHQTWHLDWVLASQHIFDLLQVQGDLSWLEWENHGKPMDFVKVCNINLATKSTTKKHWQKHKTTSKPSSSSSFSSSFDHQRHQQHYQNEIHLFDWNHQQDLLKNGLVLCWLHWFREHNMRHDGHGLASIVLTAAGWRMWTTHVKGGMTQKCCKIFVWYETERLSFALGTLSFYSVWHHPAPSPTFILWKYTQLLYTIFVYHILLYTIIYLAGIDHRDNVPMRAACYQMFWRHCWLFQAGSKCCLKKAFKCSKSLCTNNLCAYYVDVNRNVTQNPRTRRYQQGTWDKTWYGDICDKNPHRNPDPNSSTRCGCLNISRFKKPLVWGFHAKNIKSFTISSGIFFQAKSIPSPPVFQKKPACSQVEHLSMEPWWTDSGWLWPWSHTIHQQNW